MSVSIFGDGFSRWCSAGDEITATTEDGHILTARIESDDFHGAPWDESDCHGEVSEWTSRKKAPGELVLHSDHGNYRYYDFAGACEIARRDGWGARLPDDLIPPQFSSVYFGTDDARIVAEWWRDRGNEENAKRCHISKREIAARAARADFEFLRKWCTDQWHYVGIVVTLDDDDEQSLWGIECGDTGYGDCSTYLTKVAGNLANQLGIVVAQ